MQCEGKCFKLNMMFFMSHIIKMEKYKGDVLCCIKKFLRTYEIADKYRKELDWKRNQVEELEITFQSAEFRDGKISVGTSKI